MSVKHNQSVNITGDIIGVPQLKQIQNPNTGRQSDVAECKLAIIEQRNNQEYRTTLNIEAFGPTARLLASVPQGHTVIINGKIQNKKYQDKQTGQERWMTKILAFGIGIVGPSIMGQGQGQGGYQQPQGGGYQNNQGQGGYQQPQGGYQGGQSQQQYYNNNNFTANDIPF